MPVVVRELIIRAEVAGDAPREPTRQAVPENERTALIEDCVEQVLTVLTERERP